MTENKINQQLVKDVVRILSATRAWDPEDKLKTWEEKLGIIAEQLNTGHEQKLIDKLNTILGDTPTDDDAYIKNVWDNEEKTSSSKLIAEILQRPYISNTRTLLRYRVEAGDKAGKVKEIPDVNSDLQTYLDICQKELSLRGTDEAVIGYEALEICDQTLGDPEKLRKVLENKLQQPLSVRVYNLAEPMIFREKTPYLGHKIWFATQMLPVVIVRKA